jgi:hypothetical protein
MKHVASFWPAKDLAEIDGLTRFGEVVSVGCLFELKYDKANCTYRGGEM